MTYDPVPASVRWIDAYRNLLTIVKCLEKLPRHIQEQQAQQLYRLVFQFYQPLKSPHQDKSRGVDAVMSLYKSKQRKRWYDNIPELHNALNMIRLLPEPDILRLNERCVKLAEETQKLYDRYQSQESNLIPQISATPQDTKSLSDDTAPFLTFLRQLEQEILPFENKLSLSTNPPPLDDIP